MEGSDLAIRIQDLRKQYGSVQALRGVNLEVRRGEILGFLGPNGAGKTTTIRCMLDLIRPNGGRIEILGLDPQTAPVEVRRQIGYLPGELNLESNLSVEGQLKYIDDLRGHTTDWEYMRQLAARMELNLKTAIKNLSKGNKQKVGVVQALMGKPVLLLLDEPTSGLDPLMQQRFFDLIAAENQKGATVLFSSHILPEVQKLCSRVAIIRDGLIVKVEDMKTLRNEKYKRFAVEFAETMPADFLQFPGVVQLEQDGPTTRFLYGGDINQVLARLYGHTVINLLVEEPSLEEIFLHYYRREDQA